MSLCIFSLVPKLYFPIDHPNKDPITAIAKEDIDIYLDIAHKGSLHSTLPLVHALVKPFSIHNSSSFNPIVDASLSRVINLLVTRLRMCSNKHLIVSIYHFSSLRIICKLCIEYICMLNTYSFFFLSFS